MAVTTVSSHPGPITNFITAEATPPPTTRAEATPPPTARGSGAESSAGSLYPVTSRNLDRLARRAPLFRETEATPLTGRATVFRAVGSPASPLPLRGVGAAAASLEAILPPRSTTTSTQPAPYHSLPAPRLSPANPQSSAGRRECQASRASLGTAAAPPGDTPYQGASSPPAALPSRSISMRAESTAPLLPFVGGRELCEPAYGYHPERLVQFAARVAIEIASQMPPQPTPVVHVNVLPSVTPESRSKKLANITAAISSLALSAAGLGIWRQLRPQGFIEAGTLAAERTLANLLVGFAETAAQKGSEAARAAIPELSAALRPPLELLAMNAGAVSGKKAAEEAFIAIQNQMPNLVSRSWWHYVVAPWKLVW